MSGTLSDTIENPESFQITEENVGGLSYSQINQLYQARGGHFSDYEIYCFQNNHGGSAWEGSTIDYVRQFCNPEVGEYIGSVDLGNYSPPPTYYNASNIDQVNQLLMDNDYKLSEEELNQLYSNKNFGGDMYNQLEYVEIPQDYQIDGITNAKDLVDYLSGGEYNSSKYDAILADIKTPGDKGADYHSDGFNTEVSHFAATIQNIALAHADISNIKANEKISPSYTLQYYTSYSFNKYVGIKDVDFDSYRKSIADFNKEIEGSIATMFDDINNIKRNLMLIDDEFREAFNEEMKDWFDSFDFGDTGKDSFFTSDRVLSLLKDAYQSGLYNSQEKAVLQNIIDHSEYAQMEWYEKALEGTKVFVISAVGGVAKAGEQIIDGVVNFEACTIGQAVYLITGDDTFIRVCDDFIATDYVGGAVDSLLGSTCNVYYLNNEGKYVKAVGGAVGEIGGTALITVCTGGSGLLVSSTVTVFQVSGKGAEAGLGEIYAIADARGIPRTEISTETLLTCNNVEFSKGVVAGTIKILMCGYDTTDALGQTVHVGGIGSYIPEGTSKWLQSSIEKGTTEFGKTFANSGIEWVATGGEYTEGFNSLFSNGFTAFGANAMESIPLVGGFITNKWYKDAVKISKAGAGTQILPDANSLSGTVVSWVGDILNPPAYAETGNMIGVEALDQTSGTESQTFYEMVVNQHNE